jgi:hypothetical protein
MIMKRVYMALILCTVVLSACSPLSGGVIDQNRQKWQNSNITHYRFDLSVSCLCSFIQHMPLSIEVENRNLISMSYRDGTPLTDYEKGTFGQYDTIDALFIFTKDSIAKADEIHVQYDPKYGYPSNVQIDFIKNAVDDEMMLTVDNFEALP